MAVYKGIVKPNKYNFNAVAKTITFDAEYTGLEISDILTIHNVVDNIEIYNFTNPLKGGTLVGLVLTLTFDTTTMSNTDDLTIVVGANDLAIPVVGTVTVDTSLLATATKQDTGNISLSNLDSNIGVQTDISATTDTGTFSLISLFKRALTKLTSILSTQTDGSQKTKITDGSGTVNTKQLGNPITNVDVGLITNTVIHGQTTGGGVITDGVTVFGDGVNTPLSSPPNQQGGKYRISGGAAWSGIGLIYDVSIIQSYI